ncbi:MAG: putative polymerase, sigma-24 subunit, subfamily [Sphingobacteriales bacterium]|nr:putative polymerase, sigma-24 subunit, subfamily [Sphingobacteriales bacterium]
MIVFATNVFCKDDFFLMQPTELLPHLFRTEYRKITSVLCKLFGIEYIEVAEDIVSETFLAAAELWGMKGLPENPTAWLYSVSKNKTRNYLKRNQLFAQKISEQITQSLELTREIEIDLSVKNINDSQLAMIFAVCNPCIPIEAQIGLALNLLCGFGVDEIASAFLTNKEVIYKRLQRAKQKLKAEKIKIEQPTKTEINNRLPTVLTTLYLLFNEGYYSTSQNKILRKELCLEAMRLNYLLVENEITNQPPANALLSLMCFHSSRFEARVNESGENILYEDQDPNLWNKEIIEKGTEFLNIAFKNSVVTKYHLEAGIAYCHTQKEDSKQKWETILQLYNQLLQIEYSPIIALNRTYALAKAQGKKEAIIEAEKLNLTTNHLYYSLLGNLYTDLDNAKALKYLETALALVHSLEDRMIITKNIDRITAKP